MILTENDTLLSLEDWRAVMQLHPFRFWQLDGSTIAPQRHACDDVLFEYDWQASDRVSRTRIRQAISEAETKLRRYLQYDIAPRYYERTVQYPLHSPEYPRRSFPIDSIGRWVSLRLPFARVQKIGARGSEHIGDAAVVLQDTDGDGVYDTFTASIVTTATDASQIAVYVADADRSSLYDPVDPYRIRPVSVAISGGSATITGSVWLIVKRSLYESVTGSQTIDVDTATNYLSTVSVYREYINPDGTTVDDAQATLLWETEPYPAICCTSSAAQTTNAADPASIGKAIARVGIRDARSGIVTPGQAVYSNEQWQAVDWSAYREPDRVQVRFLAGAERESTSRIQSVFRQAAAYMATAELEQPICACEMTRRRLYYWQFDLASTSRQDETFGQISAEDLNNPFGTRRGQVMAWKLVQNEQSLSGFAI
jgi:hypothetical protein